ncbi:type III secretion system inner membrane ring lipoprotein SctJ [Bradyrhizobium sp. Tv2a-2]|uniref:type III secretion system inner membrane ring lipoprotein SctJ n=1 Tax=Bradyrhizobium sp. Tv2a-2 TaxID=113395 RepID=UPI0004024A15|nr:type III secretion inner membrane ring lipoprotein SctJ [Bradyrhizobium sp. Tv2a-2]
MSLQLHHLLRLAVAFVSLALAGCKTELYSRLPEADANEMLAVLMQRGIAASKNSTKDGGVTIIIDEARFTEAMAALNAAGYPRKKFESMGDVFKSGGLVPSPTEERARFLYAIDQELSATISQIDGVLSARVEVVLPDNDILSRTPTPSSASVFVRYEEHSGADRLVPQIKMLVASSVQGLTYDRVSVVLVAAAPRVLPPIARPNPVALWPMALAALAGGLAASGAGALLFRLRLRPFRELLVGRRQGGNDESPVNKLTGPVS